MKYIEPNRAGAFLSSEANGNRSRDEVVVKDGQDLKAGQLFSLNADGKAVAYADGETVIGVIYDNVAPSGADGRVAVIVRDAEVIEGELVFFDGITTDQKNTAITGLKALGIITR